MFYFNFDKETIDRYDPIKFMRLAEGMYDILDSFFLISLYGLPTIGTFRISSEEYRPDLVAYKIYKDVQYWWILMLYNNFMHYRDLKVGTSVNYPSGASIEDLYFKLKSKELKGLKD